eukprot:2474544-Rhodomonas_salina.1
MARRRDCTVSEQARMSSPSARTVLSTCNHQDERVRVIQSVSTKRKEEHVRRPVQDRRRGRG